MCLTIDEMIKNLAVFGSVKIRYSDFTKKFYVHIDGLEIKDGDMLQGISEHRDTVCEAIEAFCNTLKGKSIVVNAYTTNRREYVSCRIGQ